MTYQQLIALLPCHSLDDFPFYLEGSAADQVLDSYTALWHPALIAHAQCMPTWRRNDDGEEKSWEGALVTMPQVCRDDMPGYWLDELRAQGAFVLDCAEMSERNEIMAVALAEADIAHSSLDPSILKDFLALGFCHLLTEVLTVRMRYSSLLDVDRFTQLVIEAATFAIAGEGAQAKDSLGKCFDALTESKSHYYPVDSFLYDLTLFAPTTPPKTLAREIATNQPMNLLISAQDVQRLHELDRETFDILHRGVAEENICLVGGEISDESPLSLLSQEGASQELEQGISLYEQYLGVRPFVFGRRRFGLSCNLPQLLSKWGFVGALHYTLDGNRSPESYHGSINWQGTDGSELSALARAPLDAQKSESFLSLPRHIGDAMDNDHMVAIGFAHWPQFVSRWYRDLQRIAKYGAVLGKFVTLKECFRESNVMSGATQFEADDYRSPLLRESAAAGVPSISPLVTQIKAEASTRAAGVFCALAALLSGSDQSRSENMPQADAALLMSEALPRTKGNAQEGYLVLNPYGSPQPVVLETDLKSPPQITGAVKGAAERNGHQEVLLEVPPFGYAWVCGDSGSWSPAAGKPLYEMNLLRNEFFEVHVDAPTGAIKSIYTQSYRGNILSQRLALRMPQALPGHAPVYSTMEADEVVCSHNGPFVGSITSRGRLLDSDGALVARFEQTVRVMCGSPIIYIDVLLDPIILPEDNPWQSYYACRFAWPGSEIYLSVGMTRLRTHRRRLEAPHYLDLQSGSLNVTLLSNGLPYHVLVDDGQIDTLLIAPGETARRFQFALGIDLPSPARSALASMSPPQILKETKSGPSPNSGWLLHISAPHVVATHQEAISAGGKVSGMRLRLLETRGRSTLVTLQSFCNIGTARKSDFLGNTLEKLSPDGDRVTLELVGSEICVIELIWQT